MATLIYGGDVVTPQSVMPDGAVLTDGSRIARIGLSSDLLHDPAITQRIDAGGRIIAPGFIDLQLNGANGRLLTSEPTSETVLAMSDVLPQFGCTSVVPTVITAPVEQMIAACQAVAAARQIPARGSNILGIHLEGPFINSERAGAHHVAYIAAPAEQVLLRFWHEGGERIRMLTLAPEIAGTEDVIRAARRLGITVAIGHTNAGPSQIDRAVHSGATIATHLFNAMAPLGSRAPGTIGGVLANDESLRQRHR